MGFWLAPQPLVLASRSAARRGLVEAAGLPFEAVDSGVDERAVDAPLRARGADAATIATALARAKALAVSARRPGRLVLGADQTLALAEGAMGDALLFKPDGRDAARRQVAALAGRTHALHSAFTLARDGAVLREGCEAARLTARPYGADFVDRYLDAVGDGAMQSVGGYAIEGMGVHLFERVEGDHSTILGLPMLALLASLRALGAVAE